MNSTSWIYLSCKVLHCLAGVAWLAWTSSAWSSGLPPSCAILLLSNGPNTVVQPGVSEVGSNDNTGKPAASEPAQEAQKPTSLEPTLNLESLKQRLRETSALGFFTKLELRSQVAELLDNIGTFHKGSGDKSLVQLRERFNLLVLKVLTLLEGKDAPLHQDIAASREELWAVLADPVKFEKL